jgi:hypothetical protein
MDDKESLKFVGGMAAGGAGLGLISILYDAIRSERRRVKAVEGKDNPGALEMYLPPIKQAVAAQVIGGMGAAAGAAYLVQSLYKKWKGEELKREIDEAAIGYLGDIQKTAGVDIWDIIAQAPRDLLYLAPLAAAGGTFGLLEHTFPRVTEKPKAGLPRKITIKGYGPVVEDGPGDGPLAEQDKAKAQGLKVASFSFGIDDQIRAAESLCLMVTAVPTLKDAACGLTDILGAYQTDPEAVREVVKQAGYLAAVAVAKGGSEVYYALPDLGKRATVRDIFRDPVLAPSMAVAAVAEFNELQPAYAKVARAVADDFEMSLLYTKLASVLHLCDTQAAFARQPNSKQAGDWRKEMSTLDVSESQDTEGDVNNANRAYRGGDDPIDQFMAGRDPSEGGGQPLHSLPVSN